MKTVKMKVPEGGGNVSFEGNEYPVGADGVIEVPEGAVMYLAQYGYTHMATEAEGKKPNEGEETRNAEGSGEERQAEASTEAEGKKPAAKTSKQAAAKQ